MRIGLIKYNVGNIKSLLNYFNYLGHEIQIIETQSKLDEFDMLLLPGVGSFQSAMNFLRKDNFLDEIYKHHSKQKKIFGICLGFQLFCHKSNENNFNVKGLDFVKTNVCHLSELKNFNYQKIPHIGWDFLKNDLLKPYYFLHSYGFSCNEIINEDFENIDYCNYEGIEIASLIESQNLLGVQFHPEKSDANFDNYIHKFIAK